MIMGMEQEAAADWKGTQEKMKTLYREGYTAPTDPTNQVSPDRALSFFNRLCALCSLLRVRALVVSISLSPFINSLLW